FSIRIDLAIFLGLLFRRKRLSRRRLIESDQLVLLHVDPEGQPQETGRDAAAIDTCVLEADHALLAGALQRIRSRFLLALIGKTLHFPGNSEATGQNQLVALKGQPALSPQPLAAVEPAPVPLLGVGLPALIALDDPRDGGLIDAELGGDPALLLTFHFDPLEDQVGRLVGLPGAAGAGFGGGGCGRHGEAPGGEGCRVGPASESSRRPTSIARHGGPAAAYAAWSH